MSSNIKVIKFEILRTNPYSSSSLIFDNAFYSSSVDGRWVVMVAVYGVSLVV